MLASIQSFRSNSQIYVLILSVFLAGICSIIYELLIGTVSSYYLGDSITQFSLTIGVYMAAMGVGSYISRFLNTHLLRRFIEMEIALAFLGGLSVPILHMTFVFSDNFLIVKTLLTFMIGLFIGLEIPFLTRLLENKYTLKSNISNVLSLDYFGALLATLIFPFVLLPWLGTFMSSLFFGLINAFLALINIWTFRNDLGRSFRYLSLYVYLLFGVLITMMFFSNKLINIFDNESYEDSVVFNKQTNYQKIVVTRSRHDLRLYLNQGLQFSSIDEYRYHESLIHIPMSFHSSPRNVLLLGAGDGLAVRELLKISTIEKIDLVDLDPEVVKLASNYEPLVHLNEGSLKNSKVRVFHDDALVYLRNFKGRYDFIVADLPDPSNTSLAKFYGVDFYRLVKSKLNTNGLFVTQATSPFFAKNTYWCIVESMKRAQFEEIRPFHTNVPSFGHWGFVMAGQKMSSIENSHLKTDNLKYLDHHTLVSSFVFPKDFGPQKVQVSTLDRPIVLSYYQDDWKTW